jgi:oligoribonuclease NrnB/cAMP/cGMP phosphodiesterase (DHH superfamily)
MSSTHVFTDADLDGSVSYLTLLWFKEQDITVTVTTERNLKADFESFFKKHNIESFKKIYILDLDISRNPELYDKPNVTIVDHHQGSLTCDYKFKYAKVFIENEGSTCRLLYKKLKEAFKKDLDTNKKLLVSIGHDYDSYTLKNKELSVGLNTLFWNLQGNRLEKFSEKYKNGFVPFTSDELKIILFYRNKIKKHLEITPVYIANVKLGKNETKICSLMTDFCINEFAHEIIEQTKSDIGFIINPKTETVSFRRSKNCTIDLSKLAAKLCGGGGHEAAAGGPITEKFLEFSKLFNSIERNI